MKSVWVLERFVTKEEAAEKISKAKADVEMLEAKKSQFKSEEDYNDLMEVYVGTVEWLEEKSNTNDGGYWDSCIGRSNYKAFCEVAKKDMRIAKKEKKFVKWRVVKGEVEDDSWTWAGYVNAVPNDGVLRYLYATM